MMKWHSLILQVFAAVCSYLIISTTGVTALEIRIFTSGGQEFGASMAKFSDLIQKDFTFPYQQNYQYTEIRLASKSTANVIKKIYLFRCKTFSPSECIENGIEPVISVNSGSAAMAFDETYKWDDVSSSNIGNFLTMVKIDVSGKEIWVSNWDKITKAGINTFNRENYESDRIDLYLNSGVAGETVKSYIESYSAIPSDNINRTVFASVSGSPTSKIHYLSGNKDRIDPSGTNSPSFYSGKITGTVFNMSHGTWDFVFAADGKTANPAVFYSTTAGPQSTGGASLVVDNWSPQVATCFGSEVINVNMHAVNASMGYYQSYYYSIGGVRSSDGTMTCSLVNPNASVYSYQCSIPVSAFPVCVAPGTATVNVYFNYQGGVQLSGSFPVTLKAPTPRLVVSSLMPTPFDCGIDKELVARLSVSNPSGAVPKISYTFDGRNFNNMTCTGSGEGYLCNIAENSVCQLLQESLSLTFKFTYGDVEVLSLPANVLVTFPPPSIGIDTVTPQSVESGKTTSVNALLHVNYPDFMAYAIAGFNYKYMGRDYTPANCSLETSYSNIKYYKCPVSLEISSGKSGIETLSFRLDGFKSSKPHQLFANSFFEILPQTPEPALQIISTSSPLKCVQDASLTVTARVDNAQGTPTTAYSIDSGKTYKPIVCSASGSLYTCTIAKNDLCDIMSSSLTLLLKFTYSSKDVISGPQNIYVTLPDPHMQVYSITPDTVSIGESNKITVNLFVQEPKMAGANPAFTYSYMSKASQKMTCSKVSSTSNRDFYECTNVAFDVPDDYSKTSVPTVFAMQGTTISFPMNIPVGEGISGTKPWLDIVSTIPSRIEVSQGNETQATFHVAVNNAVSNELKHQASIVPNKVIASGTCTEANVDYNFDCNVVLKADKTAKTGALQASLTLRIAGKSSYDISNTTNVYVVAEGAKIDIQTVTPETLYCEGSKQQNVDMVKVTANAKSLSSFSVIEEDLSFNGKALAHTARYCTQQAQTINCNIPTDKLFEGVACGSGELVPGAGAHYYPLTLTLLVKSGDEQLAVSGTRDIAINARPLEPYLDIVDSDVVGGVLQNRINCLGSQSVKLGDTGYVRVMYADLLHAEPKADDVKWSFTLEAQDDKGKLTKGMGTSPDTNATSCRFISYQKVGVHRVEDYECSLYFDYKLFQRCETGDGQIKLTATAGGKKAEGIIDAGIIKDDSKYQFDFDIVTSPSRSIDCQVQSYGKAVPCSLASDSNQNVTIRVYNRNAAVGMADLSLYDFDVAFKDAQADAGERSLGNCQKNSKESDKYLCPFQIGPAIKLPDSSDYFVTNSSGQAELPDVELGSANVTIYVKYAGDLERKAISKLDGTITIHPKKSDSMINAEKMREKMANSFKSFQKIFKIVVYILSFCAVCQAGNTVIDKTTSAISEIDNGKCRSKVCTNGQSCNPKTGMCDKATYDAQQQAIAGKAAEKEPKPACVECVKNAGAWVDSENKCYTFTELNAKYPVPTNVQTEDACPLVSTSTGSGGSNTVAIIATIAASIGLVITTLLLLKDVNLFGGDVNSEKSDITKSMEKGIKWGVAVCVVPRIVGELGAWIAKEDSKTENVFEGVSAFGRGIGKACDIVMSFMPLIMGFLQFYVSYIQFESCMDMVQTQAEMSATATSASSNTAYAAQAQAQVSSGLMTQMTSCFTQFSGALDRLTTVMYTISNKIGTLGTGSLSIMYLYKGLDVTGESTICGPGQLEVRVYNQCKSGVSRESITITGDGCGNSWEQVCNYNNYNTQISNQNYNSVNDMTRAIATQGCRDGSAITIRVTGYSTQTKSFTYRDSATATGCNQPTGGAAASLKKDNEKCSDNSECNSALCCDNQQNGIVQTSDQRCESSGTDCECIYVDSTTSKTIIGRCSGTNSGNCGSSPFCPTGHYCC